jgi:hypothetical protein
VPRNIEPVIHSPGHSRWMGRALQRDPSAQTQNTDLGYVGMYVHIFSKTCRRQDRRLPPNPIFGSSDGRTDRNAQIVKGKKKKKNCCSQLPDDQPGVLTSSADGESPGTQPVLRRLYQQPCGAGIEDIEKCEVAVQADVGQPASSIC